MFDLNPRELLQQALLFSVPGFWALTIHEFAHAWTAVRAGDPTPEASGRLTLNPLAHLDPIGTVCILLVGFGWARPVPVNPYNFRNMRRDNIVVSVAGVGTNLAMALVSALIYRFVLGAPIPNFDSITPASLVQLWVFYSVIINLVLAMFNLLPIPPLDGSHVVETFVPYKYAHQWAAFSRYGMFILLALIFTGVIDATIGRVLFPVARFLIWGP